MSTKSQGTHLYAILPDDSLVKIKCVTGLNYSGGNRATKDSQCLDDVEAINEPGELEAGTLSPGINIDPANDGHFKLWQVHQAKDGVNLKWAVGLSDGTAEPTVTDGDFVFPESRTWLPYFGFIQSFPFDAQAKTDYKSSITIQLSGSVPMIRKAAEEEEGGGA